ncbi:transmembrane protein, putative (macronuclear) [Tetrahymena thermophila SB210]|uniref:Transmembrane protein, putative n=1 Tax=Tetrahymena thermophila (strain SB210) TaxID=312017 RepID=W7XAW7_TETTS|nr:transmembrane protein, putative [Tetrahymena thermophila SB210]EWS73568.1 transmembrane protein, putative [Tetrahymena thermophila SB210]|eukprot:XP_012653891.1 transmembrane protein, putative [Tetrahymena thermophila SB210]
MLSIFSHCFNIIGYFILSQIILANKKYKNISNKTPATAKQLIGDTQSTKSQGGSQVKVTIILSIIQTQLIIYTRIKCFQANRMLLIKKSIFMHTQINPCQRTQLKIYHLSSISSSGVSGKSAIQNISTITNEVLNAK